MVIADFDEQGFELVSRIHREEGRHHQRTAATVTSVEDELFRAGLRATTRATGCLHDVVVLLKEHGEAHESETPVRVIDE